MGGRTNGGVPIAERVHDELKARIIDCLMKPGAPISEERLSEEFGCSRTPVREALLRLRRERLVEISSRKGIFVREILLDDIHQIYQMRLILEPQAARLGAPALDARRLREFRAGFEAFRLRPEAFPENLALDRAFHDYLVAGTGNGYLMEVYRDLRDLNHRLRVLSGKRPERVLEGIDEHVAVADALLSGDGSAVSAAMERHIRNSLDEALRIGGFARPL